MLKIVNADFHKILDIQNSYLGAFSDDTLKEIPLEDDFYLLRLGVDTPQVTQALLNAVADNGWALQVIVARIIIHSTRLLPTVKLDVKGEPTLSLVYLTPIQHIPYLSVDITEHTITAESGQESYLTVSTKVDDVLKIVKQVEDISYNTLGVKSLVSTSYNNGSMMDILKAADDLEDAHRAKVRLMGTGSVTLKYVSSDNASELIIKLYSDRISVYYSYMEGERVVLKIPDYPTHKLHLLKLMILNFRLQEAPTTRKIIRLLMICIDLIDNDPGILKESSWERLRAYKTSYVFLTEVMHYVEYTPFANAMFDSNGDLIFRMSISFLNEEGYLMVMHLADPYTLLFKLPTGEPLELDIRSLSPLEVGAFINSQLKEQVSIY